MNLRYTLPFFMLVIFLATFVGCKEKKGAGDKDISPKTGSNIGGSLYFQSGEGEDKEAFPACLEYWTTGDATSMAAVKKFVTDIGQADDVMVVASCKGYKAKAKFGCRIQDKEASKMISGVSANTMVTYITYYMGPGQGGAKSACEKKAGAKFTVF